MVSKELQEKRHRGSKSKTKRHKKKSSSLVKSIMRKLRKDPFKLFSALFGGLLLLIITVLFVLYAREAAQKKNQLQKNEIRVND